MLDKVERKVIKLLDGRDSAHDFQHIKRVYKNAERLDSLCAIGIARTFSVGGSERRSFYNPDDPFWKSSRALDDREWTLDHFGTKLLKLKDSMHTKTAKEMAQERARFMELFIKQLQQEL